MYLAKSLMEKLIHTGALDSLQVLEEFLNCLDTGMLE